MWHAGITYCLANKLFISCYCRIYINCHKFAILLRYRMYALALWRYSHSLLFASGSGWIRCLRTVLWFSHQRLSSPHHPVASSFRKSHSGQTNLFCVSGWNQPSPLACSTSLLGWRFLSASCFADMDSCAGIAAQFCVILWICAALQSVLRDLQSPNQPSGGGNPADVSAHILHHLHPHHGHCTHPQVHTPKITRRTWAAAMCSSQLSSSH